MDSLFTSFPSTAYTLVSLPSWIELAAIVVGSISGLLVAYERKFDLVGYIGLALICGLGGGLLRDMMMQRGGVYMIDSPLAIPTALATAVVVFFIPRSMDRFPHLLEWVDILAVGIYAAVGTDKALVYQLNPFAAILMGTITGVGGGMLRDVFLGEVPRIFQPSYFYAVCAVAGSTTYWAIAAHQPQLKLVALIVGAAVAVILRRVSLRYHMMLPADVDLSDSVARRIGSLRNSADERPDGEDSEN